MGATLEGRGGGIVLPGQARMRDSPWAWLPRALGAGRPDESCRVSGRPSS